MIWRRLSVEDLRLAAVTLLELGPPALEVRRDQVAAGRVALSPASARTASTATRQSRSRSASLDRCGAARS